MHAISWLSPRTRICQMTRPEQLKNLIDEDALQRARIKRQKVDQNVSEKVSITKKMYGALDVCIKKIGERTAEASCLLLSLCFSWICLLLARSARATAEILSAQSVTLKINTNSNRGCVSVSPFYPVLRGKTTRSPSWRRT